MKNLLFLIVLVSIISCNPKRTGKEELLRKNQFVNEQNPVEIMVLQRSSFKKELVSNGKLKARRKSILTFKISEELVKLPVKNGDFVKAGQVIARLKQEKPAQDLEQAKMKLAKARLDLQDILIGQGYDLNDSIHVPKEILEVAMVRSGYASAQNELETAKLNYSNTVLKAPFTGIIANLKYKIYEQVKPGEEFCTLIDNSVFEVEFSVLEPELKDIATGKGVKVVPFSLENTEYKGKISEINPVVDESGLIQVKAVLYKPGKLMEGMNVKVLIENNVPDRLVVPKQAVVLRDNQEVLFKYIGGKAFWTYVQIQNENSTSYAVIADPDKGGILIPGDTVIISGNLNLAHESDVVIE